MNWNDMRGFFTVSMRFFNIATMNFTVFNMMVSGATREVAKEATMK